MRYVFVTGGVVSGIGKGLTTASLGLILHDAGYKVGFCKIDPYLNCDAGTLSPHQHGEVFVLRDGTETDLDLGNYERLSGVNLDSRATITTGSVYLDVIDRERRGEYLGRTVQVIPHLTNRIQERLEEAARGYDLLLVELGGTVGDIESMPFLEAIRQFRRRHAERTALIHLTLVPCLASGEIKTKPSQHSVSELNRHGLRPNILACRCSRPLPADVIKKLEMACESRAISLPDIVGDEIEIADALLAGNVPVLLEGIIGSSNFPGRDRLRRIRDRIRRPHRGSKPLCIGLVGKYHAGTDSYRSVVQALNHAAWSMGLRPDIKAIDPENADASIEELNFLGVDALVVPGGFGSRGIAQTLSWLSLARQDKIPCLGLCLGMQLMVIDLCRSSGNPSAGSEEFGAYGDDAVIHLLPGCRPDQSGGDLRRGLRRVYTFGPTNNRYAGRRLDRYAGRSSHSSIVEERFRHRYFADPHRMTSVAIQAITGWSDDLPAILDLADHPFYVGTQFHPEFQSDPLSPHPLFLDFVKAACQAGEVCLPDQPIVEVPHD